MNKELKEQVVLANKELPKRNMVLYSWGNVSAIDRDLGIVVIKPVGMPYDELTVDNVSVVDLESRILEGPFRPSVDLPIHMALYEHFPEITAIVHTHSTYATMLAQLKRPIPCLGTTHADYFRGEIPCARDLTDDEINGPYEYQTGMAIVEELNRRGLSAVEMSAILSPSHGPFTWGSDVWDAVHKTVVLEEIARMAWGCFCLNPEVPGISNTLLDRHFLRKHGPTAYFTNDDYGHGMVHRN